jgi:PilZ domain-containing protein
VTSNPNEPAPQPAPATPRRSARRPVSLDGYVLRADGASVDISLLDLNYDGCCIATPVELEPGEPLKLSVIGRGLIDAEVRWCKDGKAGLFFSSGEDAASEEKVSRQAQRSKVKPIDVRVRRVGQNAYSVRIFDLSPEGARVEVVERPRVGEQMMLKFDGLEVLQSEVCWIDGFIVGLKFERPLHPAVFDLLLARMG